MAANILLAAGSRLCQTPEETHISTAVQPTGWLLLRTGPPLRSWACALAPVEPSQPPAHLPPREPGPVAGVSAGPAARFLGGGLQAAPRSRGFQAAVEGPASPLALLLVLHRCVLASLGQHPHPSPLPLRICGASLPSKRGHASWCR